MVQTMTASEEAYSAMNPKLAHWHPLFRFLVISGAIVASPLSAMAQLLPIADDTLGNERSLVSPDRVINNQPSNQIDGGARRGVNLFHSFREFSIDAGRGVYFTNPAGVANILTRVTGGNASQILGTLGVLGNANLFLINPNGILFGSNAQLDVGGSFLASTANSFKFPNGSEFSATNPQAPPLLTINVPLGLQTGSIPAGSAIANRGNLTVGQDLTLTGGNLDLEGQLRAGGDLTLLAQGTVRVRDTTSTAFVATAGRDLTVQGNGGIDILALQHLEQTPFVTKGTLSLISDGVISADAHFASGGNFQIRSLSGQPAQLTSLYDPIISSAANVDIAGEYNGLSLLIESQGNVRIQGAVTITAPDTVSSFIGEDTVLSTRPGLIIRSGQSNLFYGGINQGNPPVSTNGNIPAGITLQGAVQAREGVINLMTGTGDIRGVSLDTAAGIGTGGAISLSASGNITTSNLNSSGAYGDGGKIILSAGGYIATNNLNSSSFYSGGGAITVLAGDSITTSDLNASSSFGGRGGAIAVHAGTSITTGNVSSISEIPAGKAGDGGTINLRADTSSITTGFLNSYSHSNRVVAGDTGNGGPIALFAGGNITTSNLDSYSGSFAGYSTAGDTREGGAIALSAGGNIMTSNLNSYSRSSSGFGTAGNARDGGAITLSAGGTITTSNLTSYSFAGFGTSGTSGTSGNGGAIALSARGDIRVSNLASSSFTTNAGSGYGGAIALSTDGNITTNNLFSSSYSGSGNANHGGAIQLSASGNITTRDLSSSASVGSGNASYGGAIALFSSSNDVRTGSIVWGSSTPGQRNGILTVNALDAVDFQGSLSPNGADTVIGNQIAPSTVQLPEAILTRGGSIQLITTGDISLQDTDLITSSRTSNSGQIQIQTPGTLTLERSRLFTSIEPGRTGTGGNIALNAGNLVLNDFSVIDTATFGTGDAGNLSITAANAITLNHSDIVSVTAGNGNAGRIDIQAGGDVTLQNRSSISTAARDGAVGRGGDIEIELQTGTLTLTGGSQLQAFTLGREAGGNITIQAPNITVTGFDTDGLRSGIFTSSDRPTSGSGGTITVNTPGTLRVANGGVLSAQTLSNNRGGNITVTADTVELLNRGQLITNTADSGQAGTITLNAARRVVISGNDPALQQTVLPDFTCVVNGASCSTTDNLDVEFSTRIPYATLEGARVPGTDTYTVNISTPGTRAVFDVDGGGLATFNQSGQRTALGGIDTSLALVNAQGVQLAINDNDNSFLGEGGSQADSLEIGEGSSRFLQTLSTGRDAYLRYVFSTPGTYTIRVGKGAVTGNPSSNYALHVSLEAPAVAGRVVETSPTSGLFARTTRSGGAGDIRINTPQLNVSDQAQVSVETLGQGDAGSITLQPFDQGRTLSVNLNNGRISGSTSTSSSGKGGGLIVTAPQSITIAGPGQLAVETSSTGDAGNMTFTTQQLTLKEGVEISASTFDSGKPEESGKAGEIVINAEALTLSGGAKVSTNSSSSGSAGDLKIQANDQLFLAGQGTGLFARTTPGSTGNGGNIKIDSRLVQIEDEATLAVNSQGSGIGGSISVQADRLGLNQQGSITAETASAQGGNISLDVKELLLLRHNSLISATAGTAQAGGDGGNITFNGDFIVAVPKENSDITANAFTGQGGRVEINAQGLFGIQFRPQLTPLSDITASSERGAPGVVTINTPDVDPNRGLVQLPTDITDASRLIVQACPTGDATAKQPNEFIITGRGGLPPTPSEAVNRDAIQVDLVTTNAQEQQSISPNQPDQTSSPRATPSTGLTHTPLVEAQSWQLGADGRLVLVASAPQSAIAPSPNRPVHCP
jgi:filamentous hemagglutinin family protein